MKSESEVLSKWLFRLSVASFGLACVLPVFPESDGFAFPGMWVFLTAPFVAFGVWVTFLFEGFEPQTLLWAVLLTVTTAMNGVFLLAPFLREAFAERPLLISVSAGLSAVAAAMICHLPPGSESILPVWSAVELAWIASFALMSASGVAGYFAESQKSPSIQEPLPR